MSAVTEQTNYMKLSKKSLAKANNLTHLNPYKPVVREILKDFKPTHIQAKIVKALVVTIHILHKSCITDTSEFKYNLLQTMFDKSSGS
jgi:hypothetical protein